MIMNFLNLQLRQPTKGDWASTCLDNLLHLQISESLEDIRKMPKNKFKKIVSEKIKECSFQYLLVKQGSKGSQLKYSTVVSKCVNICVLTNKDCLYQIKDISSLSEIAW